MSSKKSETKKTKFKFGFTDFFRKSEPETSFEPKKTKTKVEGPLYCSGFDKTGLELGKNPNEIPDDWIWL